MSWSLIKPTKKSYNVYDDVHDDNDNVHDSDDDNDDNFEGCSVQ